MTSKAEAAGGGQFGKHWQDKLRLMDAIDSLRVPTETPRQPLSSVPADTDGDSGKLREKLHVYEQTCALLEREVQVLEQQTLAALAEAGRLRRELDRNEAEKRGRPEFASPAGLDLLERRVADAENERRLLLDALENSEAELARMARTLDLVVRKLQVA